MGYNMAGLQWLQHVPQKRFSSPTFWKYDHPTCKYLSIHSGLDANKAASPTIRSALRFAQVLATHMRSFFLPRCSSRVSIFTRHWHMPGPWKPTWVAQQLASKVCGGFEFWKQFWGPKNGIRLGEPTQEPKRGILRDGGRHEWNLPVGFWPIPGYLERIWSAGHGTEVGLHSPNRKVPTIPSTFQPSHG